jgi:hypothetical protein
MSVCVDRICFGSIFAIVRVKLSVTDANIIQDRPLTFGGDEFDI